MVSIIPDKHVLEGVQTGANVGFMATPIVQTVGQNAEGVIGTVHNVGRGIRNTPQTLRAIIKDPQIALNALKRAGISTVESIKNFPGKSWKFIKSKFTSGGKTAAAAGEGVEVATVDGATALADTASVAGKGAATVSTAETIVEGSGTALKGVSTLAKVGEVAGKLATPLLVVAGAAETGIAMKKGDGHGAAKAMGRTAGGLGGMWAAGALVGAIAGTFAMPIIGTIALGIVGAIAGSMIGSKVSDGLAGDWMAKKFKKDTPHYTEAQKAQLIQRVNQLERQKAILAMRAGETDTPATNFSGKALQERAAQHENSVA